MEEIRKLSEKNQQRAWKIIRNLEVIEIWKSIGATVNLVGSLEMKLMVKHLDIDFHVYTDQFCLSKSFDAIAKLAEHPEVKRIEYTNFLEEKDACVSWTVWVEDNDAVMWHLDIIHIVRGSRYDGYFEKVAERIGKVLTKEQRDTILRLKYETPSVVKIMGIEYYRAVIEGGISTFDDFLEWREKNPAEGIIEWMPK